MVNAPWHTLPMEWYNGLKTQMKTTSATDPAISHNLAPRYKIQYLEDTHLKNTILSSASPIDTSPMYRPICSSQPPILVSDRTHRLRPKIIPQRIECHPFIRLRQQPKYILQRSHLGHILHQRVVFFL